jgi:hypothetical protein
MMTIGRPIVVVGVMDACFPFVEQKERTNNSLVIQLWKQRLLGGKPKEA